MTDSRHQIGTSGVNLPTAISRTELVDTIVADCDPNYHITFMLRMGIDPPRLMPGVKSIDPPEPLEHLQDGILTCSFTPTQLHEDMLFYREFANESKKVFRCIELDGKYVLKYFCDYHQWKWDHDMRMEYQPGDICVSQHIIWRCVNKHTASQPIAISDLPLYNSTREYTQNNIVAYRASRLAAWRCVDKCSGCIPGKSALWVSVSESPHWQRVGDVGGRFPDWWLGDLTYFGTQVDMNRVLMFNPQSGGYVWPLPFPKFVGKEIVPRATLPANMQKQFTESTVCQVYSCDKIHVIDRPEFPYLGFDIKCYILPNGVYDHQDTTPIPLKDQNGMHITTMILRPAHNPAFIAQGEGELKCMNIRPFDKYAEIFQHARDEIFAAITINADANAFKVIKAREMVIAKQRGQTIDNSPEAVMRHYNEWRHQQVTLRQQLMTRAQSAFRNAEVIWARYLTGFHIAAEMFEQDLYKIVGEANPTRDQYDDIDSYNGTTWKIRLDKTSIRISAFDVQKEIKALKFGWTVTTNGTAGIQGANYALLDEHTGYVAGMLNGVRQAKPSVDMSGYTRKKIYCRSNKKKR